MHIPEKEFFLRFFQLKTQPDGKIKKKGKCLCRV